MYNNAPSAKYAVANFDVILNDDNSMMSDHETLAHNNHSRHKNELLI